MILHTGMRTDIPAFYAPWFVNRLREGEVCVRNPYDPTQAIYEPWRIKCRDVCTHTRMQYHRHTPSLTE